MQRYLPQPQRDGRDMDPQSSAMSPSAMSSCLPEVGNEHSSFSHPGESI
jgi:hypothetical protein